MDASPGRVDVPRYAELLNRTDAPPGSSWGVWGPNDDLGTLNFITEETVRRAATAVVTGERFSLDLLVPTEAPAVAGQPSGRRGFRSPAEHHLLEILPTVRDDYLDGFYLQSSTQIDGLRHILHPEHGFYDGVEAREITAGSARLGIHHLSAHGLVARGVLVDVAARQAAVGGSYSAAAGDPITVAILEDALGASAVDLRSGDLLLLRTGWLESAIPTPIGVPGLEQSEEMVAWLWDHELCGVAADNPTVEVHPPVVTSPFVTSSERAGGHTPMTGMMHHVLIPLLGFCLGELWNLEDLAAAAAADGRWDCMVVAHPLAVIGGVGSPANATAIR